MFSTDLVYCSRVLFSILQITPARQENAKTAHNKLELIKRRFVAKCGDVCDQNASAIYITFPLSIRHFDFLCTHKNDFPSNTS